MSIAPFFVFQGPISALLLVYFTVNRPHTCGTESFMSNQVFCLQWFMVVVELPDGPIKIPRSFSSDMIALLHIIWV
jgi:hypothetical protein